MNLLLLNMLLRLLRISQRHSSVRRLLLRMVLLRIVLLRLLLLVMLLLGWHWSLNRFFISPTWTVITLLWLLRINIVLCHQKLCLGGIWATLRYVVHSSLGRQPRGRALLWSISLSNTKEGSLRVDVGKKIFYA